MTMITELTDFFRDALVVHPDSERAVMERATTEIRPELARFLLVVKLDREEVKGTDLRWVVSVGRYLERTGSMVGSTIHGRFADLEEAQRVMAAAVHRAEGNNWRRLDA